MTEPARRRASDDVSIGEVNRNLLQLGDIALPAYDLAVR